MSRRRNTYKDKSKRVILVALEGNNKTEKKYLNNFSSKDNDYVIKVVPGNETDPVNLVKQTIEKVKSEYLNLDDDDRAYCIFDTDVDITKNAQINQAKCLAEKNKITLIVSCPCIEIWFLLHYEYTTATMTNNELIKRLKTYYPKYNKSCNIYKEISQNESEAIIRAKKLSKYHLGNHKVLQHVETNPYTEMYKLIEEMLNRQY